VAEEQKFRFIPGRGNVPIHDPKGNGSNGVAIGVAVTIALSGLAGGGLGGATSVSEYGSKISRSESDARANRTESDARASGTTDALRITSRLRRQGYRVTVQAEPKQTNCDAHSDGYVRTFFVEHPCRSLYRQLIEIEDKKNVIMLGMATIEMPDLQTAMDLKTLLDQADRGKVIQLNRESGKYRHFSFANSLFTTTRHGATVTVYDGQIVSGAATDFILIAFFNNALFGMGG
jgi:hypothetical protein